MPDDFGDRMKLYEGAEESRLMPLLPILVRLDGNCFSKFTTGLVRPFDERLSNLMALTTEHLVREANARIGYTQSDEITLVLYSDTFASQVYFGGRIQKITSVLAAKCSTFFNAMLPKYLPEKVKLGSLPVFDCRVWNVPNKVEAVNAVLWREHDATKNSISMAARCHYSHRNLHEKNGNEMQEMLFKKGVNWNDYPSFFKRGIYIQRRVITGRFTVEEIERLPEKHEARSNPDLMVERADYVKLDLPPLAKVVNRVDVVFDGQEPQIELTVE